MCALSLSISSAIVVGSIIINTSQETQDTCTRGVNRNGHTQTRTTESNNTTEGSRPPGGPISHRWSIMGLGQGPGPATPLHHPLLPGHRAFYAKHTRARARRACTQARSRYAGHTTCSTWKWVGRARRAGITRAGVGRRLASELAGGFWPPVVATGAGRSLPSARTRTGCSSRYRR